MLNQINSCEEMKVESMKNNLVLEGDRYANLLEIFTLILIQGIAANYIEGIGLVKIILCFTILKFTNEFLKNYYSTGSNRILMSSFYDFLCSIPYKPSDIFINAKNFG